MIHLKLTIAYDGTGLVGWQRQPTGISVQALLEDALAALDPAGVTVTGAGRTDAGVHALAQVASVNRVPAGSGLSAFSGNPEQVAAHLAGYWKAGARGYLLSVATPHDAVTIRRFAVEVMPRVRELIAREGG